jgi:hypothetical protein
MYFFKIVLLIFLYRDEFLCYIGTFVVLEYFMDMPKMFLHFLYKHVTVLGEGE